VQDGEQLAIGPPQAISLVECANWPGGGGGCLPEYSESRAILNLNHGRRRVVMMGEMRVC
jgi:hypothetical protein